jgi:hypothetical protein
MEDNFDIFPVAVRRRLRDSPFNLCPACLEVFFVPKVLAQHPGYSREKALLMAIEVMELLARRAT